MISFKQYLRKNVLQKTTLFFAMILIILNMGVFYLNSVYEKDALLQKETSFATIVQHISRDNELPYVVEYVKHYGHIHNSAIKFYYDDSLAFESELKGNSYNKYFIGDTENYVLIDSSESTNSQLANWLIVVTNILFLFVYVISTFVFYTYSKNKTKVILHDLDEMIYNVREKSFTESHFKFVEYQNLYDEFKEMYTELINSRLLKDNHLQSITHDLKTSLTVLSIFFEGALNDRVQLDKKTILKLSEEVKFINNLIESLSDEYKNNFSSISLSKLLLNITSKYETIFTTKNIKLVTDIDPNLTVSGETESFVRIIQNILSNSFYYSNQNTIVNVSLKNDEGIVLTITDQGIGISKDELSKIFSKNYRIKTESHRNVSGSGLGLYIVKLLVEELSGQIHIESSDQGTTVTMTFSS